MSKKEDVYYYKDGTTSKSYDWTKVLHRIDGPAVEYTNGNRIWYIDGKRHKTDGPAMVFADGSREWYVNGEPHRVDGPAMEHASGHKSWCIDGTFLTSREFNELIKQINKMNVAMKLTDPRWWVRELGEREVK
jgi:hypothetical protein